MATEFLGAIRGRFERGRRVDGKERSVWSTPWHHRRANNPGELKRADNERLPRHHHCRSCCSPVFCNTRCIFVAQPAAAAHRTYLVRNWVIYLQSTPISDVEFNFYDYRSPLFAPEKGKKVAAVTRANRQSLLEYLLTRSN